MDGNPQEKQNEKGQSLVEMALLIPILLIILAGVLDLGRLYFAYISVTDAAGEGAAYAAVHPPSKKSFKCNLSSLNCNPAAPGDDCICERVLAAAGSMGGDFDEVLIQCPTCPGPASGAPVTVTVTYNFGLATPFLNLLVPNGVLPLRASTSEVVLVGPLR